MKHDFENSEEGSVALLEPPVEESGVSLVESAPDPVDDAVNEVIAQLRQESVPREPAKCPDGYEEIAPGDLKLLGVDYRSLMAGERPWTIDVFAEALGGTYRAWGSHALDVIFPDGAHTVTYPAGCLTDGPAVRLETRGRVFFKRF